MLLIISLIYIFLIKIPFSKTVQSIATPDQNVPEVNNAYFTPPVSLHTEVKVRGKVVSASQEKEGATHKILDEDGSVIVYAKTNDDKLKQQEGNFVILVGTLSLGKKLSPSSILDVSYIAFK